MPCSLAVENCKAVIQRRMLIQKKQEPRHIQFHLLCFPTTAAENKSNYANLRSLWISIHTSRALAIYPDKQVKVDMLLSRIAHRAAKSIQLTAQHKSVQR